MEHFLNRHGATTQPERRRATSGVPVFTNNNNNNNINAISSSTWNVPGMDEGEEELEHQQQQQQQRVVMCEGLHASSPSAMLLAALNKATSQNLLRLVSGLREDGFVERCLAHANKSRAVREAQSKRREAWMSEMVDEVMQRRTLHASQRSSLLLLMDLVVDGAVPTMMMHGHDGVVVSSSSSSLPLKWSEAAEAVFPSAESVLPKLLCAQETIYLPLYIRLLQSIAEDVEDLEQKDDHHHHQQHSPLTTSIVYAALRLMFLPRLHQTWMEVDAATINASDAYNDDHNHDHDDDDDDDDENRSGNNHHHSTSPNSISAMLRHSLRRTSLVCLLASSRTAAELLAWARLAGWVHEDWMLMEVLEPLTHAPCGGDARWLPSAFRNVVGVLPTSDTTTTSSSSSSLCVDEAAVELLLRMMWVWLFHYEWRHAQGRASATTHDDYHDEDECWMESHRGEEGCCCTVARQPCTHLSPHVITASVLRENSSATRSGCSSWSSEDYLREARRDEASVPMHTHTRRGAQLLVLAESSATLEVVSLLHRYLRTGVPENVLCAAHNNNNNSSSCVHRCAVLHPSATIQREAREDVAMNAAMRGVFRQMRWLLTAPQQRHNVDDDHDGSMLVHDEATRKDAAPRCSYRLRVLADDVVERWEALTGWCVEEVF